MKIKQSIQIKNPLKPILKNCPEESLHHIHLRSSDGNIHTIMHIGDCMDLDVLFNILFQIKSNKEDK